MPTFTSDDPLHPSNVICELCRLFYDNNWVTGTGGGISIRENDQVYIAPSGVQKERIQPWEMFVVQLPDLNVLHSPNDCPEELRKSYKYKQSACTPLFMSCYTLRDAGACIHTHSQAAVMITLIQELSQTPNEFRISGIEQIKALPRLVYDNTTQKVQKVGNMENYEELVIPIIENTPHEEDLVDSLEQAIRDYPGTSAVLVRRHGIYVWGENIWKAKVYNEALDYLLELALKMREVGVSWTRQK